VNGGDCPMPVVCQQNRQAVGSFYADQKTRLVGQQRVALAQTSVAIGVDGHIGMDLAQGSQGLRRIERSGTEAVFQPIEPGESTGAISVLKKLEVQN
jgi:hypothetical protein